MESSKEFKARSSQKEREYSAVQPATIHGRNILHAAPPIYNYFPLYPDKGQPAGAIIPLFLIHGKQNPFFEGPFPGENRFFPQRTFSVVAELAIFPQDPMTGNEKGD